MCFFLLVFFLFLVLVVVLLWRRLRHHQRRCGWTLIALCQMWTVEIENHINNNYKNQPSKESFRISNKKRTYRNIVEILWERLKRTKTRTLREKETERKKWQQHLCLMVFHLKCKAHSHPRLPEKWKIMFQNVILIVVHICVFSGVREREHGMSETLLPFAFIHFVSFNSKHFFFCLVVQHLNKNSALAFVFAVFDLFFSLFLSLIRSSTAHAFFLPIGGLM